jgi:hypothetical protein
MRKLQNWSQVDLELFKPVLEAMQVFLYDYHESGGWVGTGYGLGSGVGVWIYRFACMNDTNA